MRGIPLIFLLAPLFAQVSTPVDEGPSSKAGFLFTARDFLVPKSADNVAPLTAAEKLKISLRYAVSPAEFLRYAAQAGISQAQDHDANYGQGWQGYSKRFAERFADGTLADLLTHSVFPTLRHEDPRYFQLGEGSFLHRASYAFSRIFVTRADAGDTEFNVSELAGSATAAGISTFTYHSRGERTLGTALNIWGTHVAFDALRDEVMEFWPEIWRKIAKGRK